MFTRLKYNFEKPIYAITNGLNRFTGTNGKGIDYKKIWSPEAEKIYNILPKRYWDDFYLTVMSINRDIPPHTDSDIDATINFYFETDNCETVFYEPIVNKLETVKIENQTNGCIYKKEQLKQIASFVAKPMEVWILDVTKIHSVETPKESVIRKAITLHTQKHTYLNVCEMLKETECI